ncbi:unnamed protein product, partial [Urochloa humidicola]
RGAAADGGGVEAAASDGRGGDAATGDETGDGNHDAGGGWCGGAGAAEGGIGVWWAGGGAYRVEEGWRR